MSKVNFIGGTQSLYNAIPQKDVNSLYFISDTHRIYKGDIDFTQNVYPVVNFPTVGVANKIYIHKNTLEVKVYDEGRWYVVSPGYIQTVENLQDASNGGKLATIDAIKGYVDTVLSARSESLLQDVNWDATQGKLKFKGSDSTTVLKEAQLEGVAHDAKYDPKQLRITIPQYGKDDLVVDLPKDNFLADAYFEKNYDFQNGTVGPAIVLVVKSGEDGESKDLAVPADAMMAKLQAGKTDSIQVNIDENNKIKARIIIDTDTADGALMIWDDDGKKIGTIGVTINQDKTSELGNSTKSIPTAAVVAAAIKKACSELSGTLLSEGNPNEVVISTANGIVRSGMVIGGATLSNTPSANIIATEAAVLDAISWKTLA